jgi:hypothetical protein
MITDKGKRICDKEIRKRGKPTQWGACRRPAVASVPSRVVTGWELDYCKAHLPTQALRNAHK